jgi:monoamine oxidase
MKRRDFLLSSVGAAAGLALTESVLARVSPPRQKVIVAGGGLAGLVAAYELDKLGFDVKVLEAQSRVGGRVHTIREFSEGLYADAGAARIPSDHDTTLKYVREFELPLIPFYPAENKFMRYQDGRVEPVDWGKFAEATSAVMPLGESGHWQKIKGGNDLLPRAFARRLGLKVVHQAPVVKIAQTADHVQVSFTQAARTHTEECDRLVCAIPFSMLAKIEISPGFSSQKQEVIRSLRYDSASRVMLETKQRFWTNNKLNGFAFGDWTEIWDASFGEPGTHGIIERYLRGGNSTALIGRSEAERASDSIEKLSMFFPELRSNFVKSVSKCWSEDPWVLGAWAYVGGRLQQAGREPEGRVHFAGEHLSDNSSWMQGALKSGLRAVSEILAAPAAARA